MSSHKHVLVTGGAGFIGSHLVERLLADGRSVVVLDDLSTGRVENLAAVWNHPRLRVIKERVSECGELRTLTSGVEGIYHLAAAVGVELVLKSPIRTIQTNLRETEAILEAASQASTPLLLASSSEVYGKSRKETFSEEDDLLIGPPSHTRWNYACSKLMDEFLALAHAQERKLPLVIARIFNTVGPGQIGQYGMVLPRFIEAAKAGQPLRVFGDGMQTRCFSDVADTVEALIRLQATPDARGQVVNVGSAGEIRILDLARLVIEKVGSSSTIEFVPYEKAYAPGFEDMQRRRPDVTKLRQLTGLSIERPLSEIVERTIAAAPRSQRG